MTSGAAAVSELFLFAGAAFSRLAEQTTLALQTAEDSSGRLKWTSAELQMLRDCVARHGHTDLARIAETLRTKSVHQIKAQIRRSQLLPPRQPASLKSPPQSLKRGADDSVNNTDDVDDVDEEDSSLDVKLPKLEEVDVAERQNGSEADVAAAAADDADDDVERGIDDAADEDEAGAAAVTPAPPPPPLAGVDADLENELAVKEEEELQNDCTEQAEMEKEAGTVSSINDIHSESNDVDELL
ncbi:hypothetical protein BOX15_Mlig033809g2 [Macrostomum lignano]|uniref:Myb-like domain-containing protein n=1 Tax=Macrostomum lignano TaxID=282301 RepID=A0A267ETF0_9PLAT|nr:hypothetical protein BOX15_Mlig033809g2 [Macrostomum lignano]